MDEDIPRKRKAITSPDLPDQQKNSIKKKKDSRATKTVSRLAIRALLTIIGLLLYWSAEIVISRMRFPWLRKRHNLYDIANFVGGGKPTEITIFNRLTFFYDNKTEREGD
jgi:hypothetical protein